MALVRTNITLPGDVLDDVDALAGPRGRSAYLAELIRAHVRRERQRRVFEENFGAMIGKPGHMSPDEILEFARHVRSEDAERGKASDQAP
ncbi:MAG: hypothetical protein H0X16_12665 [Chloroflexi bacterium]|nr:hypothetical protein [Chloroflexota bacterium]